MSTYSFKCPHTRTASSATTVTASHFPPCYHRPGRCLQTCMPATLPGRQASAHRALRAGAAAPGAVPAGSCPHSGEPGAGGSLEIICYTEGSHTYCFWAVEALIAHHLLSFLIKGLVSPTVAHVTPINLQQGRREERDTTPTIHRWDARCKIIKTKLVVKEIKPCSNLKYLVNWWENVCDLCLCLEVFPSVKAFKGKPDFSCNVVFFYVMQPRPWIAVMSKMYMEWLNPVCVLQEWLWKLDVSSLQSYPDQQTRSINKYI